MLDATLKNADGSAVNLTGAAVTFHMRKRGATTAKVDAATTIVDAVAGTVRYSWAADDTDTEGMYDAEFEVVDSAGEIQTFPGTGYLVVEVVEDLA